jgi:hypothetical protein
MTPRTRMTEAEAIERARQVAEAEGWPWEEPISAITKKKGLFSKLVYWQMISNGRCRGRNAIICIDDESGEVLTKGWLPR